MRCVLDQSPRRRRGPGLNGQFQAQIPAGRNFKHKCCKIMTSGLKVMHLRHSDKTLRHEGGGKSSESVEIQTEGTEKRPGFGRLELVRDL